MVSDPFPSTVTALPVGSIFLMKYRRPMFGAAAGSVIVIGPDVQSHRTTVCEVVNVVLPVTVVIARTPVPPVPESDVSNQSDPSDGLVGAVPETSTTPVFLIRLPISSTRSWET